MTRTREGLGSAGLRLALGWGLALLCNALSVGGASPPKDVEPTAGLTAYVRAMGPFRPFEMLLSPPFGHRNFREGEIRNLGAEDFAAPDFRERLEAEVQIQTEYEGQATAATLWAQGILRLCRGSPQEAVALLEKALQLAPRSPKIANDLAVAYRARGEKLGRDFDSLLALIALHRALDSNPALLQARFNRLLLLEDFKLPTSAAEGWRQIESTKDPALDLEIADRRDQALEMDRGEAWEKAKAPLLQTAETGADEEILAAVQTHVDKIRDWWTFESLDRWAADSLKNGSALDLRPLERIAAAHAQITGDPELPEIASALKRASDQWESAARSVNQLAVAHQAINDLDLDRAEELLEMARPALESMGGPLPLRAKSDHAVCVYYRPAYADALGLLDRLHEQLAGRGYRGLEGRVQWMRGLSSYRLTRYASAVEAYQDAISIFGALREPENQAAMHNLLALTFEQIGMADFGWEHRVKALRLLRPDFSPRRRQQILRMAGEGILNLAGPPAAIAFLDESVAAGLGSQNPLLAAIAFWSRARLNARLGLQAASQADIAAAKTWCQKIPDHNVQAGVSIDIAVAEAESLLGSDPARAVSTLTQALELCRRRDNAYRLISVLDGRASAYLRAGNRAAAAADIAEGIGIVNNQEKDLRNLDQRSAFLDKARSLFEKAILLEIEKGHVMRALEIVAQARSLPRLRETVAPDRSVKRLLSQLPADLAILEYFSVQGVLRLWAISRDSVRLVPLDAEADLAKTLNSYIGSAATAPPAHRREFEAELYSALVKPAEALIKNKRRLVVIPDGDLSDLPFSSLYDRRHGRYLFERFEVQISPGLYALETKPTSTPKDWRAATLVAFGDPEPQEDFMKTVPRLPSAREEVAAIARLFPGVSTVRTGPEATEKNFENDARTANFIHMAVHSGARAGFPGLLLAPDAGETDGRVGPDDLVPGRFPQARLVVLSACGTARALDLARGQTFGLAGRLLASGVPTVVASYWEVEDEGTAALMKQFYAQLLSGKTPAAALRAAKRSLARQPDWSLSSAWAAFEVIG